MTIDDLLLKINNPDDIVVIKKAYEYAQEHLKDKKRANGDKQIDHALAVTDILIGLNVDTTTIVSGLLHDVIDIGDGKESEIENLFGEEVLNIITSVSKINKLEMVDDSDSSALYLRKVMVGLCDDVRVLFIKLADRLHNMKTMECFTKEHQKKVASETLRVLVPIAHRLGMYSIKGELENLCLYYQKPEVYNDILEKLNNTTIELDGYLKEMKESISSILKENGIKFEIKGRVKSVFSIYNKLQNGKKWEDIYDILALRVFVEKESECYAVVGLIHSKYRPVPNRFKDYIAIPKENMYQSLHTTVIGPGGKNYEVQIRTYEMDEIAEKGIASHWSYKEKGTKRVQSMMEQKLELYRSMIESNEQSEDKEFTSLIDNNILSDLIYVFTPKGDVVELPQGSTPIDFAYRIHTAVGDKMVGAIVNEQMIPINSALHDGDVVKIMTSPNGKPNKDWLSIVKTPQAKDKIKSYFSKKDREGYIERGKSLFEKEVRKRKLSINELLSEENINKVCSSVKLKDLDEIYLSIGSFRYTANYIISVILGTNTEDSMVVKSRVVKRNNNDFDILIDGEKSIQTHIAKCCLPVKGDNIKGIITKNDGIAVHRDTCPNIKGYEDREVNVSWNDACEGSYSSYIIFNAAPEKIDEITLALTTESVKILGVSEKTSGTFELNVSVANKEELDKIVTNLTKLRYVKGARRK